MTKPWRIHEEAVAEIDSTVAWYDGQRPGLGLDYLAEVRAAIAIVREAPSLGTAFPGVSAEACARRRRLRRFPHVVVFVESANEYVIVAVAHLRRGPGYWLARVEK